MRILMSLYDIILTCTFDKFREMGSAMRVNVGVRLKFWYLSLVV